MDLDQIDKRVQWMEDEHRKDKDAIALLENRILAYEGGIKGVNDQIKEPQCRNQPPDCGGYTYGSIRC